MNSTSTSPSLSSGPTPFSDFQCFGSKTRVFLGVKIKIRVYARAISSSVLKLVNLL